MLILKVEKASGQKKIFLSAVTLHKLAASYRRMLETCACSDGGNQTPVGASSERPLGNRGVAWGTAFRYLAADDEPIKVDRDKRSPAAIGRPFGFSQSQLAGYLRLQPDSFCVEDPSSSRLQHDYIRKRSRPIRRHAKHGSDSTLPPWPDH
jgi:hypothetical protein